MVAAAGMPQTSTRLSKEPVNMKNTLSSLVSEPEKRTLVRAAQYPKAFMPMSSAADDELAKVTVFRERQYQHKLCPMEVIDAGKCRLVNFPTPNAYLPMLVNEFGRYIVARLFDLNAWVPIETRALALVITTLCRLTH
jgi:hypothetical protein